MQTRSGTHADTTSSFCSTRRAATVYLAMGCLLLASGCGSRDPGPRSRVYGEVTLDGRPVEAAAIIFHSQIGKNAHSVYGFVEQGHYEITEEEGPLVGPACVQFQAKPIAPAAYEAALEQVSLRRGSPRLTVVDLPTHYGQQSSLKVDVTLDGENQFDFHLKSRP